MVDLTAALELDPDVSVRPEPFGGLAYHHRTRRLVFLRSVTLVELVRRLADHPDVRSALVACDVPEIRWPSMVGALEQLERSELVRAR